MKKTSTQTKIIIIMAIVLISGLVGAGYFWGRNAMMKKQIKLVEELNEKKLEAKDLELAKLADSIAITEEEVVELKKDNVNLKKERDKNKEEVERLKKKIEDAPPETLLAEARRILDTREIWLIDKALGRLNDNVSGETIAEFAAGAEFSLTAFRKAAWIFTDWENFTLIREPNYLAQIKNDAEIKSKQSILVLNWMASSNAWKDKYFILDNTFTEWKKYANKKQSIWSWLSDKALTFSIGYFVGKLTDKLL